MTAFAQLLTLTLILALAACTKFESHSSFAGLEVEAPVDGAYVNSINLTVSGQCRSGAVIEVSGDITDPPATTTCLNSTFSFVVTLTSGQVQKNLSVVQKAGGGATVSEPVELSITLDTGVPAAPTITDPVANMFTSNPSLSINGACETGTTVLVAGAVLSPPITGPCLAGTYSVGVTFSNGDGAKAFNVRQRDIAGNLSPQINRTVTVDTLVPGNAAFTTPASNNFRVSSTSQTVAGTCEAQATVLIAGNGLATTPPLPLEVTCSTAGTFSRGVTLSAGLGTKTVSLTQMDRAGNTSGTVTRNFILEANPLRLVRTLELASMSEKDLQTLKSFNQRSLAQFISTWAGHGIFEHLSLEETSIVQTYLDLALQAALGCISAEDLSGISKLAQPLLYKNQHKLEEINLEGSKNWASMALEEFWNEAVRFGLRQGIDLEGIECKL